MGSPQLKPKQSLTSYDAWDPAEFDVGNDRMAAGRFEPGRTQFQFEAPAHPAAERRLTIGVLAAVAIAAIGALAALAYFAGAIAAAIAVTAIGTLIAFGNWTLNNTADLF